MECSSCNGTGDGVTRGDGKCLICNGCGLLCDVCGEPSEAELCSECEENEEDEE